jgi:hypothetical protein
VNTTEALQHLGLEPGASRDAIEAAYRERARTAHPDGGGTEDEFRKLESAKEIALASVGRSGGELVSIGTVRELLAIFREEQQQARQQEVANASAAARRDESRRVAASIVFNNTARYTERMRIAGLFGAISLGYSGLVLTGRLPPLPGPGWVLPLIGVILGIAAWIAHQSARDIELNVNYLELLSKPVMGEP